MRSQEAISQTRIKSPKPLKGFIRTLMMSAAFFAVPEMCAQAADYSGTLTDPVQRNLFGEAGLMDMPSARMAQDGTLAFTVGNIKENQRYNLTFQALPWLEAAFRFSAIESQYYDRSFSFKARLTQEGKYRPEISAGVRDILGTGVYGGEYIVASKKFGDFDLTGGLGWGRFGDRNQFYNPLRLVSSDFKARGGAASDGTGKVEFNKFLHGNMGVFGGIIWQTPIDGLKLMAEYSGDEYTSENVYDSEYQITDGNQVHTHSPINLGMSWRPFRHLQLSAAYMYGDTYALTLSFDGNVAEEPSSGQRIGVAPPPLTIRSEDEQRAAMQGVLDNNSALRAQTGKAAEQTGQKALTLDQARRAAEDAILQSHEISAQQPKEKPGFFSGLTDAFDKASVSMQTAEKSVAALRKEHVKVSKQQQDKLRTDLDKQHIFFHTVEMNSTDAWLWYQNGKYRDEAEAVGRIIRVMMRDLPPDIEYFHIISVSHGRTMREITIPRSSVERLIQTYGTTSEIAEVTEISAPAYTDGIPALKKAVEDQMPAFSFGISPKMAEHTFDPDNPLQLQFYMIGSGEMDIAPGWTVSASGTANIWNDYNHRAADSSLPHVRTDLLKYIHKSPVGMSNMELDYRARLAPDVYAMAKVGYLEDMYAGAGGQVLWRPEGSRIAFGADLYDVWKRDFDRLLGTQDYHVLTGHVSAYVRLPWYKLHLNVHAGRYLAKDYGATFELTRRFSTGVEIGAFATFTNVPFSKFGEGSFDKGIIIRIPVEWGLPVFSQAEYNLHMNSLTRDGGQRLAGDDSLYTETDRTSYEEIADHYDDLTQP